MQILSWQEKEMSFWCRFARAIHHSEAFRRRRDAWRLLHSGRLQFRQRPWCPAWQHPRIPELRLQLSRPNRRATGIGRCHLPVGVPPEIRIEADIVKAVCIVSEQECFPSILAHFHLETW